MNRGRFRSWVARIVGRDPSGEHRSVATEPAPAHSAFGRMVARELDEDFYLSEHRDAARAISAGHFESALDHYVKKGSLERKSPNASFDEEYYVSLYADVREAVEQKRLQCGFHHYVLHGRAEGRVAKPPGELVCTIDTIRGLRIDGWAANFRDPLEHVEVDVCLHGRVIARVYAERPRRDLLSILPTLDHGFSFEVPVAYCDGVARALEFRDARGRHLVVREGPSGRTVDHVVFQCRYDDNLSIAINAMAKLETIGEKLEELKAELGLVRELTSIPIADYDYYFRRFYTLGAPELSELRRRTEMLEYRPLVSIVLPTYDSIPRFLDEAIDSVREQVYPHWELCIADDASHDEGVRELIRTSARGDPRIKYTFGRENAGLAANTNRALALTTGEYVAFLDHDDRLTPDALYCTALALQRRRFALLYSDEDIIDEAGRHLRPHFKPDFNYELLLAENYLCHLVMIERKLLDELGGLRLGFDGCQDRDLMLRAYEARGEHSIAHIARVLYHWRENPASVSLVGDNRDAIMERSVRCVQQHLERVGESATVLPADPGLYTCRVQWSVPAAEPAVRILIPTKDRVDLLAPCITSLFEITDYGNYRVVVIDHESRDPETIEYLDQLRHEQRVDVLDYSGPFNWAQLNNFGVDRCEGDVVCFLNNDIIVTERGWLRELVGLAIRPEIGAVGAKLLYPDGTVQHAGIVLGPGGFAGHAFHRLSARDAGYLGRASCAQRVAAVTGACLLCRREVFEEVGGFDAVTFPVALNDVDFCLRVGAYGYAVVFTPHASAIHFESSSRGYDEHDPATQLRLSHDATQLRQRWRKLIERDPHYNPHFDPNASPYERLRIPRRVWNADDLVWRGLAEDEDETSRREAAVQVSGRENTRRLRALPRPSA